jgi:hypothetical protein
MLTDEQVQELYAYCNRKGIHYYDVQVEIVDHMANAIEAKMQADPSMEFKKALEEVHVSFGSFGLKEIVRSKSIYMRKSYKQMRRKLLWSYFTFPKVALTILLILLVTTYQQFSVSANMLMYGLSAMGLVFLYMFISQELLNKKIRKQHRQKLLMTDPQYFDFGFFYLIFFIQIGSRSLNEGLFGVLGKENTTLLEYYLFSGLFILYSIFWLVRREMIKTVHTKAMEQYPAAFAK